MKNHPSFGIAVLALITVSFSGCDKLDSITDVEFHSEFTESVPVVDATPNGANVPYSKDITLDATSDSEINTYKSKIKSFKIDKLSYIIDDSANPTQGSKFSGTLGFSASDGGSATVLTTLTNVDLDDNTTEHEVTLAQADLDKLGGYLTSNKALKIYVAGTVSKTPINVIVNVNINVTVKANAIH